MSTTHAGAVGPGAPSTARSALSRTAYRRRYALAAAIAVVGLAGSSLWAVSGVLEQTRRPSVFERADLPGSVTVTVDEAARLVLYVEVDRQARPDGGGAARAVTADQLTVAGPTGDDVAHQDYPGDLRYDVPAAALPDGAPARVGTAVASFEADVAGTYTVTASGTVRVAGDEGGRDADGATLAVGEDLAPGAARAILFPALTGGVSVLVAAGVALGTAFRQARGHRS